MKIESIEIKNFRAYKHQFIMFDDYSCFVGCNGAGKWTIFHALNLFFRQYKDSQTDLSKLTKSDFHHGDVEHNIEITVTFADLPPEAKDKNSEFNLCDYIRNDKLIITTVAEFGADGIVNVNQYGERMVMKDFKKYFAAAKAKAGAAELKKIFDDLKLQYPDLENATSDSKRQESLRDYETNHPEDCKPARSNDNFYGFSGGKNKLERFIQWVFIPATKDVTQESQEASNSALGKLLARTVRAKVDFATKLNDIKDTAKQKYAELLEAEQTTLKEISESLEGRLKNWSHPGIKANVLWKQDPEKSVRIDEPFAVLQIGERGFEGDLSRFGNGLQRSYMLALLQELASIKDDKSPTLIMGIEEPEIYQHPPQARYLAETLIDLSENGNQILICTHSPLFIPGDHFDKVRIVRECGDPSHTTVNGFNYSDLADMFTKLGKKIIKEDGMVAKLYPSLNPIINEMFFCKVLILVESEEDLTYIASYMMLMGKSEEFRKYGCHIVPVSGKNNLAKPIAIAKLLHIPTYVMFDADSDTTNPDHIRKHEHDNKEVLTLLEKDKEDIMPKSNLIFENFTCWSTNITHTIKSEIGKNLEPYKAETEKIYGQAGGLEKNPLAIAKKLQLAWDAGIKSNILLKLCEDILKFAKKNYIA
mgnify:CR=1 FL=1